MHDEVIFSGYPVLVGFQINFILHLYQLALYYLQVVIVHGK